ncbi:hypothetical protein 2050HW_00211 [Serratia phage vB_SmaM_ 2050HW]|uniref:Uncharacterized protein n=1 Tax=Serratia phage vB_SmaM_ 2050HW TaxID=2024252 RepID=A0A289YMR0_9CAUD|nr:hypothetical protein HWB23_gp211 [Serratia phage vB_SmaM_ 2050HW]ATA65546.1 hypothetical protein 2050HW_00211 [Serratia phage vB_SmaM_ 2050HW]URG14063.1 hypothetical protein [Pectobacterium phage vB_ParM-25]
MSEHSRVVNEDGTITIFVSKLGVPSKIDGRIYNASEEVIDKFTKDNIGKVVGTFGHPDMTGFVDVANYFKRLEAKDLFNSIGILVDANLKVDEPYLVIEPSKRLKKMVDDNVPFGLGIRAIVIAHSLESNNVLTIEKLIGYDVVTK